MYRYIKCKQQRELLLPKRTVILGTVRIGKNKITCIMEDALNSRRNKYGSTAQSYSNECESSVRSHNKFSGKGI